MLLDLVGVVERVEGACRHDRLRTERDGATSLLDDTVGRGVNGSGEHRYTARSLLDDTFNDGVALGVGEVGDLSGGPQSEQAIDAPDDEVLNNLVQAVEVYLALGGERSDDRRDDAGETVVHVVSLFIERLSDV